MHIERQKKMKPNDKDTYIIFISSPLETDNRLIVNLNDYELNLVKFLENLSKKLAGEELSIPFLSVKKLKYKEYKTHKLNSYAQRTIKETLQENRKAYTKIKHEVQKQIKQARSKTNGVE